MNILLIGEYSNVHWTLAEGLRALGHQVTVVSDGDRWKGYPRDINLQRHHLDDDSRFRRLGGSIRYFYDLARIWPTLKGFDVVQLINPVFLDLKAERLWPFYRYLRSHNGKVFLGAFGIDYFWVKVGMDCKTFRYSDFNIGNELRSYPFLDTMVHEWLQGAKGELNLRIAEDCDGIITGLYEYEMCYRPFYSVSSSASNARVPTTKAPTSCFLPSNVCKLTSERNGWKLSRLRTSPMPDTRT